MLQHSCLENSPPWQRSLVGHSPQGLYESDTSKPPCEHRHKAFLPVASLPQECWAWRWRSCLTWGGPGGAKCAGTRVPPSQELQPFLKLCVAGDEKASVASLFSVALPVEALGGLPCLGCSSVVQCIRHVEGPPPGVLLCRSVSGVWWASLSIVQLPVLVCWGDRGYGDGSTPCAWLSSVA